MIYDFVVHEQEIKRTDVNKNPVEDSRNYLSLRFTFDYSWKGLQKFIILQYGDLAYNLLFDEENDEYIVKVPSQILQGKCFSFSLYGTDVENNVIITTQKILIKQRKSGYITCFQTPNDETIDDVYSVLQKEIDGLTSYVEDLEEGKSDVGHTHVVTDITDIANDYESLSNKKTDISEDFGTDNDSYPTVKAVKDRYEGNTTVKNAHIHGNISSDGKIGSDSGKLVVTSMDGVLSVANVIADTLVTHASALGKIGTLANATQSEINTAINSLLDLTIEKLAIPEDGYASSYVLKQNGIQVGDTINIFKDKMLRSVSIETVGANPSQEEASAGLVTGDQYILFVVNTEDNQGTTRLILPVSNVFDLQKADETSLTLSNNGVFSIKAKGVLYSHLADATVSSLKSEVLNDVEQVYVKMNNGANTMTDSSAYVNLGTSANATQKQINSAINTIIGDAISYINL